jgi:hypothetical protein
MSAIFDFSSLLTVVLLLICTMTYVRELRPAVFDGGKARARPHEDRTGLSGTLWKLSRIGERMSPYISAGCAVMAVHLLFFR